jgi:hypothetical protein
MVTRRSVIAGTFLGGALSGLSALAPPAEAVPQSSQASDRAVEEVGRAIQGIREQLARESSFWELTAVRDQTRTFLRANGKFPDYIEVGTDVWQQVYDWHVRFQQPIALGRSPEGRYTLLLLATNLVMRTDLPPGFIGVPYDAR